LKGEGKTTLGIQDVIITNNNYTITIRTSFYPWVTHHNLWHNLYDTKPEIY